MTVDATAIAAGVRSGAVTASAVVEAALCAVEEGDQDINSFTDVLATRARAEAARVDAAVAAGRDPGPLAGVPFAVKNLFDVAGRVTVAGSAINSEHPPATDDAAAVVGLAKAGAVLVGSLNMDEYAYGFTTENTHYGPCHNPHDLTRVAGGSSGGSGAAVAAGFVPLTLGSDTNGSVRVPAALCGVFGLKPTYGRISRQGVAMFAPSLDHVGILGLSVRDLALSLALLQGPDSRDPVSASAATDDPRARLDAGIDDLRLAVADGYFATGGAPEVFEAVRTAAAALGVTDRVTIPEAARARAAALVITAAEGAQQHLADLRTQPEHFDPMTRDRFLAGAMVPGQASVTAQRFRRWYQAAVNRVLSGHDALLAPTTPFSAPQIGQREAMVDGETVATQPYLGVYTQPLSFIGLPVVSVPVAGPSGLPLGVQVVARAHGDGVALRVAAALERAGMTALTVEGSPWR